MVFQWCIESYKKTFKVLDTISSLKCCIFMTLAVHAVLFVLTISSDESLCKSDNVLYLFIVEEGYIYLR